jgi:hypothetical protein
LKSHTTHIKIFIDGYNSTGLINTQYCCDEPMQVTSYGNLFASVDQLSSNSQSARMSFSQVQPVFIVENYLSSCSYLTFQNEFRNTFLDSPVPKKSTVSHLVNLFHETGSVHDRNRSTWPSVLMHALLNMVDISNT